jgi:hypothetical protein
MFSSFNSIHQLKGLDGDPGKQLWCGNTIHYLRSLILVRPRRTWKFIMSRAHSVVQ